MRQRVSPKRITRGAASQIEDKGGKDGNRFRPWTISSHCFKNVRPSRCLQLSLRKKSHQRKLSQRMSAQMIEHNWFVERVGQQISVAICRENMSEFVALPCLSTQMNNPLL